MKNTEKQNLEEFDAEELKSNPHLFKRYIVYLMDNMRFYRKQILKDRLNDKNNWKTAEKEWLEEASYEFKLDWVERNIMPESVNNFEKEINDFIFLVSTLKSTKSKKMTMEMLKLRAEERKEK